MLSRSRVTSCCRAGCVHGISVIAAGGRLPREPTYAPILQPSSDATPCG